MCSRGNLRTIFQFNIFLKFLMFSTLMSVGSIFVADTDLERAYGSTIVNHGGGLLMVGSAVPVSQYIGSRGSEQHNTFLLVLHAVIEATLFAIQFSISSDVMSISQDLYAPELRENCLRMTPADDGVGCDRYLRSDRFAGIHLVWAHNFDLAQDDSDYYSKLEDFQKAGDCCGYGQPLQCVEDERPLPSDRLLTGVSKDMKSQRQTCGNEEFWFPTSGEKSYTCSQASDPTASSVTIGGCKYEMPIGSCKDYDPEDGTRGCASQIEASMNQSLNIQGAIIFIMTLFQVLSICSACCLCWKRKATDVIPSYLEAPPFDPYKKKKKQKVGLGVQPGVTKLEVMVGSEVEVKVFVAIDRSAQEGEAKSSAM